MNQIPNLEMRKTDKILLDNLVKFASQGVNMTIRVNDPVLLDADLTGNMRVVGEIILELLLVKVMILLILSFSNVFILLMTMLM